MRPKYKTYATEQIARHKVLALKRQYPAKIFRIVPAPDQSFRLAVQAFFEQADGKDFWAYCS